jgi:hypothetical protein
MIEKAISYDGGPRHTITKRLLPGAANCSGPEFRIDRNEAGSDSGDGDHSGETRSLTSITFIRPSKRFIDRDFMCGECR